jgi:hypothetical protein
MIRELSHGSKEKAGATQFLSVRIWLKSLPQEAKNGAELSQDSAPGRTFGKTSY